MILSSNNKDVSLLTNMTNDYYIEENEKILFLSFFNSEKIIYQICLIPIILYIFLLSFILHLSIFNSLSKRTINHKLSAKKKYMIILEIMICLFRFLQINFIYLKDYGAICIFLSLFNFVLIFALILTIFLITEQNTKIIKLPYKNPVLFFFILTDLIYFCELVNEIYNDVFNKSFTLILLRFGVGTYLVLLFFKHPNNEYTSMLSTNITYVELQEIKKKIHTQKTLSKANDSFKSLKERFINDDQIIQKNKKLPTISISFKNSFNIKCNNNNNANNFVDFYTSIYFNFIVVVSSNFYDSKNLVSRSLRDFLEIEASLSSEFIKEKYQKVLIDKLPTLNINKEIIKNSIEVIPHIKGKIEYYLKCIVMEPGFINSDVLKFLEIIDDNIQDSFDEYRNQFIITEKRKMSLYNSLSRNLSQKKKEKSVNKQIKVKIIEGMYQKINDLRIYYLFIRLSCENAYKIIKKTYNDTNLLLLELTHLKRGFFSSNINIQTLSKECLSVKSSFIDKIESFFLFKHNNGSKITQYMTTLETILQYIIDNFELYESYNREIIKDYFNDFKDDFCFPKEKKKQCLRQSSITSDSTSKFENLLQENMISYISITANNYIHIAIDFKCKIFYEICFKISSFSQEPAEINKKYKFKEIKTYIDIMKVELGIILTWPDKCYVNDKVDSELKYKTRLFYLDKFLQIISRNPKFFNSISWKCVFEMDVAYNQIENVTPRTSEQSNLNYSQDSMYINLIL